MGRPQTNRSTETRKPDSNDLFPPLMPTTRAASYCGYRTTGALRKAMLRGQVAPAGRRGGKGTWMWRREDLDAFLVGRLVMP